MGCGTALMRESLSLKWTTKKLNPNPWVPDIPLSSNTKGKQMFYIYDPDTGFFRSENGMDYTKISGNQLPENIKPGRYFIKAAPGQDGEVWISLDNEGLYRSTNYGDEFIKVNNVVRSYLFAFGKNKPGNTNPSIIIYGKVDGNDADGVYQSDDNGLTWNKINDANTLFGNNPKIMEGDRQVYGRVYIGTGGRGIFYGEPSDKNKSRIGRLWYTYIGQQQGKIHKNQLNE
jgi:hypothetical protein